MKTAATVLGIVGGSLFLIFSLIYIGLGITVLSADYSYDQGGYVALAFGIVFLIGSGLGIAGGILVKKRPTAAGVMMLVGTVLNFFNILLLLGGIFALIPEKQQPAYPYPQYPYPPYPPQQYPPYPPQQYPQYPQYPQPPQQYPQPPLKETPPEKTQ